MPSFKPTPAGERPHRLELQEKVGDSRDQHGHKEQTWKTKAILWAKIEQLSGNEAIVASQLYGSVTSKITTPFHTQVKPDTKWRLLARNGTEHYIASVNNVDGRNIEWIFICGATANG